MGGKFFDCVVWGFVILAALGVLWLLIEPIIFWTSYSEVRICVRLFIVLFALNTFATLRLYNSIVQNTRFSIKLRESITKLQQNFPVLERALRSLSSSLTIVKTTIDSFKKSTDENTDKLDRLNDKINKLH
jgi:septal ring factor EnvC (AmiA/AmiB activator)